MGEWFEKHPGPDRHIYTAHAYIASLYLSCPPQMGLHCPSPEEQQRFRQAVSKGHITWTALPHNAQIELMDSWMLQSALRVTHQLDLDCKQPQKVVLSQVRPVRTEQPETQQCAQYVYVN